jgi:hypothetical protein
VEELFIAIRIGRIRIPTWLDLVLTPTFLPEVMLNVLSESQS